MKEIVRKIALDTETTGFDPDTGDRIVEIGGVELINDMPTGRHVHFYIDPERDVPADAVKVHGLTNEKLEGMPKFAEIADEFVAFLGDAELVIHNAKFDMKFLNAELRMAGKPELSNDRAIDTMDISRRRFPGSPMTLDALCRRFNVSLENRELHGALLDSQLLGEVWLGLNGGRQPEMLLGSAKTEQSPQETGRVVRFSARQRPNVLASRLSAEDETAHNAVMTKVDASARKASKGEQGALWAPSSDTASPSP